MSLEVRKRPMLSCSRLSQMSSSLTRWKLVKGASPVHLTLGMPNTPSATAVGQSPSSVGWFGRLCWVLRCWLVLGTLYGISKKGDNIIEYAICVEALAALWWLVLIGAQECCLVGISSYQWGRSRSPLSVCSLVVVDATRMRSSIYAMALTFELATSKPTSLDGAVMTPSMVRLNRIGERGSPCFTPISDLNASWN